MLSPFLITVSLVAADRSVGGAPESLGGGIGEVLRTGARSCALGRGLGHWCTRHRAAAGGGGAGDASRSWTGLAAELVPALDGVVGAGSCLEATAAHGRLRGHRPLDRLARLSRAEPAQRRQSIAS